jgi:hypothetical protein
VVLSRQYIHRMEVRWFSLVDLWQAYVFPTLPRSSPDHRLQYVLLVSAQSIFSSGCAHNAR